MSGLKFINLGGKGDTTQPVAEGLMEDLDLSWALKDDECSPDWSSGETV